MRTPAGSFLDYLSIPNIPYNYQAFYSINSYFFKYLHTFILQGFLADSYHLLAAFGALRWLAYGMLPNPLSLQLSDLRTQTLAVPILDDVGLPVLLPAAPVVPPCRLRRHGLSSLHPLEGAGGEKSKTVALHAEAGGSLGAA